jgi:hypothetical protein
MRKILFLTALVTATCPALATAPLSAANTPSEYLQAFLAQMAVSDSIQNELPPKYSGGIRIRTALPINAAKLFGSYAAPSPYMAQPDFANTLPQFFPRTVMIEQNMAKLYALDHGRVQALPWSGSYWPTYRLGLAERYDDKDYPSSKIYEDYSKFYAERLPEVYSTQAQLDKLSPAEKYDLLVGDQTKSLTRYSIARGGTAYKTDRAATWVGICHGWAPASYMVPRPRHNVDFELNKGLILRFYPDDIKGLATLLWANTKKRERFIGMRCNQKNAPINSNNRIIDAECFDINPGTWHALVLNQVGILKQNFIMDATYDFEVWNHPVRAYALTYFNPQTNTVTTNYEEGKVTKKNFTNDKFAHFRNPKTVAIIGVSMEVEYVIEVKPMATIYDTEKDDFSQVVQYIYDLELDADGKVIGGEWYQRAHPDFVWTPEAGSDPTSIADAKLVGEWNDKTPPAAWVVPAREASKNGQPLARVLKKLLKMATVAQ